MRRAPSNKCATWRAILPRLKSPELQFASPKDGHSPTKEKLVTHTLTAEAVLDAAPSGGACIGNDLTIHVATVNGSGSSSSTNGRMRTSFQMRMPCTT